MKCRFQIRGIGSAISKHYFDYSSFILLPFSAVDEHDTTFSDIENEMPDQQVLQAVLDKDIFIQADKSKPNSGDFTGVAVFGEQSCNIDSGSSSLKVLNRQTITISINLMGSKMKST